MSAQSKPGKRMDIGMMTRIGMMGAISAVLGFFPEIPMAFFAPWLKLDFSYVPMLLTGFALGFWPGLTTLVIKNVFQLLTTNSAGVGQVADMIMGVAMLLPATLIYRKWRTRKGALGGMLAGIITMVVAGVLTNQFILLPVFLGKNLASFMESNPLILLTAVVPFNLVKGGAVCVVTYLLYKYLAPFLKRGLRG